MRKFTINMTMSYDFDVSVEANSEEEAKKIFTTTPLENLKQKAFKSFYKKEIRKLILFVLRKTF